MAFDPIEYINRPRWKKMKLDLSRIEELLEKLGNPQDELSFVHVAGTNGKGSTCSFIASVLTESGYKTGLFTSPYLYQFEERIQIDGSYIPYDELLRITLKVKDVADNMEEHPTEFELMTAVAMCYFAESSCDIVVLEVGLGGRLDSTNVIKNSEVSVITSIALDHTNILGNTVAKIAQEKAGIIKPACPVVSWSQQPDVLDVIQKQCEKLSCDLQCVDFNKLTIVHQACEKEAFTVFRYKNFPELEIKLLAPYQPYNAALALEAIAVLRTKGWNISDENIYKGFKNTKWPGRFELVSENPAVIFDGGHNPQGAHALAEAIKTFVPGKQVTFIMGVLEDKDYIAMLEELVPLAKNFVCITPESPRALQADKLARSIRWTHQDMFGCTSCMRVEVANSACDAFEKASSFCQEDDVIVICGSLYLLGSFKMLLSS